jgi:hypothetical protein
MSAQPALPVALTSILVPSRGTYSMPNLNFIKCNVFSKRMTPDKVVLGGRTAQLASNKSGIGSDDT